MKNNDSSKILILIIILFFILRLTIQNKKLNEKLWSKKRNTSLLIHENVQLKKRYLNSIFLDDYKFNHNLNFHKINGNAFVLDSISDHSILFFRYTELNCSMCVSNQIKLLNNYIDSIGIENVFIIASGEFRHIAAFKRLNKIKYEILLIDNFELDSIVNAKEAPYYFYISQDYVVQNIFIPDRNMPELTLKYYNLIRRLKLNSNKR